MIIVTSISPGHANKEHQENAVKSWQGYRISMNGPNESIQGYDGVAFISTDRTAQHYVGKPLVTINAMIDHAKSMDDDLMLINSDIILTDLPTFKQDGVTIMSRYDFDTKELFPYGFDVFYIPKKFLNIFPPAIYAMGVAFWDYWIPKHCIINKIPLYYPTAKHALHKHHVTQYSQAEWDYIGEFFKWEFKFDKKLTVPQITTATLNEIKSKLIHI